MLTATNELDVVEIAAYSVQDIEGGRIIRYLQRRPGEQAWQPVKLWRPDPEALAPCRQCGTRVPAHSLSGGICVSCVWPHGD